MTLRSLRCSKPAPTVVPVNNAAASAAASAARLCGSVFYRHQSVAHVDVTVHATVSGPAPANGHVDTQTPHAMGGRR